MSSNPDRRWRSRRREWLKVEYTNAASWIAVRAEVREWKKATPDAFLKAAECYVDQMYAGPKQALRPIYDRLLALGFSLGTGAKACPAKTIVPLYRRHVFAQIKPATQTRVDLGLAFGNMRTPKRLIDTGSYKKKIESPAEYPLQRRAKSMRR